VGGRESEKDVEHNKKQKAHTRARCVKILSLSFAYTKKYDGKNVYAHYI
jgi:hypothetical protein